MDDQYNGVKYKIKKSSRKHKKYDVFIKGNYLLSFGDSRYEQYDDKIGKYKHLNHGDEQRRKSYYQRHGKKAEPWTAKWFSHRYLW